MSSKYCTMGLILAVVLLLQFEDCSGRRSNGLIRRCGNSAKEFLKWYCKDDSFKFPFPFHRVHIILRYRAPYKHLYPFQHQAAMCCRYGCGEKEYQRMCDYHKVVKSCPKTRNYRINRRKRYNRRLCR